MKVFSNKMTWIVISLTVITIFVIIKIYGNGFSKAQVGIEKMGHLVALKVKVADVVEFTEDRAKDIPWTWWQFKYGGTKVILIVKGDCSLATDLRSATYESIDQVNRTVTIVLPTPTVLQARVIHAPSVQDGSRIYAITNLGLEAVIPGDANRTKAINSAMSLAQKKVEEAGQSKEAVDAAKENTEHVLKKFLTALNWNATIKWN